MGNYFKPLQRKMGVVTLVMALLFLAAWGRSQIVEYTLTWPISDDQELIVAFHSNAMWIGKSRPHTANGVTTIQRLWSAIMPYWLAIIPLTFLSAWLILSTPRVPLPTDTQLIHDS